MTNVVEEVHISSLVVHCLPAKLTHVIDSASNIAGVDVVAHDVSGKLILVLETENEKIILSIIDQLQALSGVLTATMVYHELGC